MHCLRKPASWRTACFPHQIEGVAFLLGRRRAILADDMGLGKTRQAIVALGEAAPAGPVLVICPASLKQNWAREIRAVEPAPDVSDRAGSRLAGRPRAWVVVNYDMLGRHRDALGATHGPAWWSTRRTTSRTTRARAAGSSATSQTPPRRVRLGGEPPVYALTGTPLTNRPRDLFPLLQLVAHPLGRSFLSFAKRYCAAEQNELRLGDRRRVEPRRADGAAARGHAAPHEGPGAVAAAEAPRLAAGRGTERGRGEGARTRSPSAARSARLARRAERAPERPAGAGTRADSVVGVADACAPAARRGEVRRHEDVRRRRGGAGREGDRVLMLRRADPDARSPLR